MVLDGFVFPVFLPLSSQVFISAFTALMALKTFHAGGTGAALGRLHCAQDKERNNQDSKHENNIYSY